MGFGQRTEKLDSYPCSGYALPVSHPLVVFLGEGCGGWMGGDGCGPGEHAVEGGTSDVIWTHSFQSVVEVWL